MLAESHGDPFHDRDSIDIVPSTSSSAVIVNEVASTMKIWARLGGSPGVEHMFAAARVKARITTAGSSEAARFSEASLSIRISRAESTRSVTSVAEDT